MKPNRNVLQGLILMGLIAVWAIVSGDIHVFFPISGIALWLYSLTASWQWPWQVYQLAVELVPTSIFLVGAYRAVFYSSDKWENRAYPLLLAITITLLAQALYNMRFPLTNWSA